MGRSRNVASFFNPLLMVIYPVPKAALMPIIMLWLGVGDVAKTLVIFLGVSLPVIYHSFQGAKAVEEKMLWSGAAMGLSAAQRMVRIVLPAALPEILTGCRTGLVLALITMITSEMIARQSGAGNILFNALDMGQYDTVFAMIIIVGAMGIGLDAAFERLRGRLVRWSEPRFDIPLSFRMNARAVTSDVLLGIVPIALLVALWQALASFGYAPATLLPPPGLVFMRLRAATRHRHLSAGDRRHAVPAVCGILDRGGLGVAIGLAAAASPAVNAVVRPIVRVLAPLPKVALYPALLLLLGFGHESKIALVAADALFPILLSTYYGASMVEQKLIWSAMAAGTPRRQILFKVVLPAAVPSILTGCRIGLVISCIVVFLAEMITSTDGLGHVLVTAARTFQAVDMFVPLITISLLGLILNGLLQAVRSYLLRGFPEAVNRFSEVEMKACWRIASRRNGSTHSARSSNAAPSSPAIPQRSCRRRSPARSTFISPSWRCCGWAHGRFMSWCRRRATGRSCRSAPPAPAKRSSGSAPVVTALQQAGFVVDCTIEGLMHAVETPEILKAGARILVISNEHPEALERMVPDAALEKRVRAAAKMLRGTRRMRVTSKAGTELDVDMVGASTVGVWGWTDKPGTLAHWPGGIVVSFPKSGTVNGTLVMAAGDINLTFKRYLTAPVRMTLKDDYVTELSTAMAPTPR